MATKTPPTPAPTGLRRVERILISAAISVAGLGVLCIVINLIGALSGASNSSNGVWPTISLLPLLAFPIVVLLIIAYVIVSLNRRSRENRVSSR